MNAIRGGMLIDSFCCHLCFGEELKSYKTQTCWRNTVLNSFEVCGMGHITARSSETIWYGLLRGFEAV